MVKYLIFTIGSIGCFIYELLFCRVQVQYLNHITPYINFLGPLLMAVSAGLFVTMKPRSAGLLALIGLSMVSKDILQNWFVIDLVMHTKYVFQFFIFITLSTIVLFLLGFIAIKVVLKANANHSFEFIAYRPKGGFAKVLGVVPALILILSGAFFLYKSRF